MSSQLRFTADYDAPRLRVWTALQLPETWTVLTGVDEMLDYQMNGDNLASIRWRSKIGPRRVNGETRVEASERPEFMTMVVDAGDVLALTTASLFDLEAGTKVDVVGQLEAHGFMSHLILPVVSATIERAMPLALQRLNDFL